MSIIPEFDKAEIDALAEDVSASILTLSPETIQMALHLMTISPELSGLWVIDDATPWPDVLTNYVFRAQAELMGIYTPPQTGDALMLDDVPNVDAAFSTSRRLLSSWDGPAGRVRRDSDNAETDAVFSDDETDVTAIAAWAAGANVYWTRQDDQTGSGNDLVQTYLPSQPLFVASGPNGKPIARFDGVDDALECPGLLFPYGQRTAQIVCMPRVDDAGVVFYNRQTGIGQGNFRVEFSPGSTGFIDFNDGANQAITTAFVDTGLWHILTHKSIEAATLYRYLNGGVPETTAIGSWVTSGGNAVLMLGARGNATSSPFDGDVAELVVLADDVSQINHNAIGQNQDVFYDLSQWVDV